jgi:hypothetical protein
MSFMESLLPIESYKTPASKSNRIRGSSVNAKDKQASRGRHQSEDRRLQ